MNVVGSCFGSLQTFASDWQQAQQEKDDAHRRKLAEHRAVLIQNRRPTAELVTVLQSIFSSYAVGVDDELCTSLPVVAAARLWYRCGMKLSSLHSLMETKAVTQVGKPDASLVNFDDFIDPIIQAIEDEEDCVARYSSELNGRSDFCKVSFLF
jgi:hypothetical protein